MIMRGAGAHCCLALVLWGFRKINHCSWGPLVWALVLVNAVPGESLKKILQETSAFPSSGCEKGVYASLTTDWFVFVMVLTFFCKEERMKQIVTNFVTERECAIWLDEVKCHLVVAEIPLPVAAENKDQALTCVRRSRVGSLNTTARFLLASPGDLGISCKKIFSLYKAKIYRANVNTQYWQSLSPVNVKKSWLTWLFLRPTLLLAGKLQNLNWRVSSDNFLNMNLLFINILESRMRPLCMCL